MLTRRELLGRTAVLGAALAGGGGVRAQGPVPGASQAAIVPVGDLMLTNGRFVDGRGSVATTVTVRNGRLAQVGEAIALAPDARTIDLGGRTVIPGLVDGHVHFTRAGVNPGYEARRIERAFSIAELQQAIADRAATAPPGAFITCIGGWNHTQFAERRRPTRAELDEAAPMHAVYISGTGGGTGAIGNGLARTFFEARGVAVDPQTGVVQAANDAMTALRSVQTPEDRLRGTADLNAHANSLGLTLVINAGNLEDQEYPLTLWREHRLTLRMRPLFPADSPEEAEARIRNNFSQNGRAVGDDLFRVGGFGERIGGANTTSPQFEPTARVIARNRWLLQQHSITAAENAFHVAAFQSIAREHPIDGLRWSLIHLQQIGDAHLKALIDLGAGASAQTWTYLSAAGGPPFRRLVESGIRAGVGTDSTNVSALDPWLSLFYMTTGRNLAGELTNDGQQISRLDALRLYTSGAAWFSFDDHHVGSFDQGKYADLAVLSDDYLTVPEDRLRRVDSVLTLVGGRIVHASAPFAALAGDLGGTP
jgi:predicted amidohydrolase YtcJ